MTSTKPMELANALTLLFTDHDTGRRLLRADLEALNATAEETEVWLDALDNMHRAAADTFFADRERRAAQAKLTTFDPVPPRGELSPCRAELHE